jgi:hypothetical protein
MDESSCLSKIWISAVFTSNFVSIKFILQYIIEPVFPISIQHLGYRFEDVS